MTSADGLAVPHKAAQDVPVPLARFEYAGGGLSEPGGDRAFRLGGRKRALEHPRGCHDSQEGPQREPGEADEFRPGERSLQPSPALLMLFRSRMIGVEQQVRVNEDHR
jgi:hypothetical protein